MSESEKMGLFGSKDETNVSTSEEKKDSDKTTESTSERYAPYSIDSDSETYDTEALSIMDINDIIGVQADTPGDSTLESEFAALSQIITDSKDEFASQMGNPDGTMENAGKSDGDSAQRRGTVKDDAKEEDSKNVRDDVKKLQNPSGMTSISKSLQLIGEAYISEDSRETDTDDVEEFSVKKSGSFGESLEAFKNSEKDTIVVKNEASEEIANFASENFAASEIVSSDNNDTKLEASCLESAEKSLESSKSTDIVKSTDSTDSSIVNEQAKPVDNATESMDIDTIEKLSNEAETSEKSDERNDDVEKMASISKIETLTVESENTAIEPEETEEPMEIDEPNEILTNVETTVTAEKIIEHYSESLDHVSIEKSPITSEILDIQPEESEKLLDKDSDNVVEILSAPKIIEEQPTLSVETIESTKALTDKCESEQSENPINEKSEHERSESPKNEKSERQRSESPNNEKSERERSESPKNEKSERERAESSETEISSAERKIEMETDEIPLEKSIVREIRSEISEDLVERSIIERVEEKTTPVEDETGVSLEKREFDEDKSSANSEKFEKIVKQDTAIVEPEEIIEPMEIDNTEQRENDNDKPDEIIQNISKNSSQNVETVSDYTLKIKINDEHIDETLQSTTEPSEIPEIVEKDLLLDSKLKESSNDNIIPAVSESREKSLSISDVVLTESLADITLKESFLDVANEDEKMEIDGSSKRNITEEEIKVSQGLASSEMIEESIIKKAKSEETIGKKCNVDTVDDASIVSSQIERIEDILEKSVPSESFESSEIVTTEKLEETIEAKKESEKKIDEPAKEEKEILTETKIVESLSEKEEMKIPDREKNKVSDKEEKNSQISIQVSQSSTDETNENRQIEVMESQDDDDGATQKSVENEKDAIGEESKKKEEEEEKTLIFIEKRESPKEVRRDIEDAELIEKIVEDIVKNEKNDDNKESTREEKDILVLSEKAECSEVKNQEIDDTKLTKKAAKDSRENEKMEVESRSNEGERENLLSPDKAESLSEEVEENLVCSEEDESLNLLKDEMENAICPKMSESSSEEKENLIFPEKDESSNQGEMENLICPEKNESSNQGERENLISSENPESSNEEKIQDTICPEKDESLNKENKEISDCPEQAESSNEEERENLIRPEKVESSNEEEMETCVSPEKTESLHEEKKENLNLSEKAEASNEEEKEILIHSDKAESSNEMETLISSVQAEFLNEKNLISLETMDSSNMKEKQDLHSPQEAEFSNKEKEERLITPELAESLIMELEENLIDRERAESSNDRENENLNFPDTESSNEKEKEHSICSEKAEYSNEEKRENLIYSQEADLTREEEMEASISSVKAEFLNKEENFISPNITESLNNEKMQNLDSPENAESSNNKEQEGLNFPEEAEFTNMNEDEELKSSEEKAESSNDKEKEIVNLPEKESSINEKEENVASPENAEPMMNEETDENLISHEEANSSSKVPEETLDNSEISESLKIEKEENANSPEKSESSNQEDKKSLIVTQKFESLNEEKEENIISSDNSKSLVDDKNKDLISPEKMEVEKTFEQTTEESCSENEKNDGSTESDEKSSISNREIMDFQSSNENTLEQEERDSSLNPTDLEEDQVDEEMNLCVEPEIRENIINEDSRTRETSLPEGMTMTMEREMENEDNNEMNLSLEPDEKDDETNSSRQIDPHPVQTSTYKSDETDEEEIREKFTVHTDDSLKDILSAASSVCVTQIFQDDEQSQSTQEMMESILVTDKGNINKILDDQEADDLESSEINEMAKLPNESDDMLDKELNDPMTGQNIDSLEGLLDLDLMPENDDPNLKVSEPISDKVMETIGKNMDVSLLIEENDTIESIVRRRDYNTDIVEKIMSSDTEEITSSVNELINKSTIEVNQELEENSNITEKDLEVFDLAGVVADPLEIVDSSEETKIVLAEDLLREIAVDEERKIKLTEKLLLDDDIPEQDLLLSSSIRQRSNKIEMPDDVFLPVDTERDMDSTEDISLDSAVRDQVLDEVAAEIENMPACSEISELETAVKFLQESEEQDIGSPLVLSPKMIDDVVVDDVTESSEIGIFANETDICEDQSELVAELESIIPDTIAISEAEIINEAAKLEIERHRRFSEGTKLSSPVSVRNEIVDDILESKFLLVESTQTSNVTPLPESPEIPRESCEIIAECPEMIVKIEHETLKKSAPIPKISILEERLKIPPKIEIPIGEVTRICELPTTPKTSLLIQRDVKTSYSMKQQQQQQQLESPKSLEKSELKIVDTPRKDSEKHDFDNVGSPRIILKIAKSAIADCTEPRSPKSPKIRSATNSPNPDDSPGQKLGKIKLKLSKSGHPSIISNDNIEDHCGQWHTEGSSSLSPLGMKIKFSKISENPNFQTDKHEIEETREQTSKHKFEEARRTESPLGMKIKLSRTGEPSIVQQDTKDVSCVKHKEKLDINQQDSPKRTESPIGMKIKLSKSGDASIIQPDKQDILDEYRESGARSKEKLEISQQHSERSDTPRHTESPLGMKFKLFKTGDASIVQTEIPEDNQHEIKRTDSPLGKKIKLSKNRVISSTVTSEHNDDTREKLEIPELPRRTESPLGMKIKLSKRGDASIIHNDDIRETTRQRSEIHQETQQLNEASLAVKIKVGKSSITAQSEVSQEIDTFAGIVKRADPMFGMKIKLSKSGDASIVHNEREKISSDDTRIKEKVDNPHENIRKIDSSIGMKIKLSKTGDASIIQTQTMKKSHDHSISLESRDPESLRANETTTFAKMKLQKSGNESTSLETEKRDKSSRRKDTEMPLEMKIKLSKTGHPTIVNCDNYSEISQRVKESTAETSTIIGTSKQSSLARENTGMKILKSMQTANLHVGRSELTIEPIKLQSRKTNEHVDETVTKRKDITISPIEPKKSKLETKFSQILPEVTIQPIIPREQKQKNIFEAKAGPISRQQMSVISQEISITQVRSTKPMDLALTDKLKSMLTKNTKLPSNDCEIIEHRPELIIVNENSNSSQDVMIIEEVPAMRGPDSKIPKKRGRPRRNPIPLILAKPITQLDSPIEPIAQRDPLALDDVAQMATHMSPQIFPPQDSEAHGRPKRTCRSQKSYAPPRRGRGRGGRGKRKMDMCMELPKRPRIEQDLDMIERSTTALITIHEPPSESSQSIIDDQPSDSSHSTNEPQISETSSRNESELYKALRQPTMDRKLPNAAARDEIEQAVNDNRNDPDLMTKNDRESLMDARIMSHLDGVINTSINKSISEETFEKDRNLLIADITVSESQISVNSIPDESQKSELSNNDEKMLEKIVDEVKDSKDSSSPMDHENWLTPSSKKQCEARNEGNISNVQVMDEETRMSAESGSRSQTPAKNMSLQAPETIVNEESQGSVLSTATTESEKVKVKIRRMEITLDPDEGPFTVDKVAEYDWPLDPMKKSETFMIQEQISHYLVVKSFKRKYPDLKRRMVDMEERNYLRENGLVSEAMCDMGLTAVLSTEVLDIMCSDFPDQYEEYRKYIREKQLKEHFKKQKELTAAANAEKNRIDLAEMAVQSALSWNVGLNKARRESRKCSLDLQTFTIHVPKKQQKVEDDNTGNHYPVALIPGQYTDYYREYTPAELRYYPLNTVLYGPMRPNERKIDSQSEGSQSDSDSDSSSDDSSSSSSEGTQDTEASQSTMDDVDAELTRQKEDIKTIKCKMCLKHLNKFGRNEVLIQCGTCNGYVHPSCIDLTLDMVPHIQAYAWQCTDCKTCAQCHDPADEDKMLFCDMCDRGYHIYCVGLRRVPQGRWHCQECAVCASCGSREAGGTNSDRNSVAQWQHEYKKGDKNTRVYVSTLCVPCSKLCGDQGHDNRPEKFSV